MTYEEQTVFPYVESLLSGEKNAAYSIDIFRRQHDQVEAKLRELKNIIIKYYPSGGTNELNGVLSTSSPVSRNSLRTMPSKTRSLSRPSSAWLPTGSGRRSPNR